MTPTTEYSTSTHSATNSVTINPADEANWRKTLNEAGQPADESDRRKSLDNPNRRRMRKYGRDLGAMFTAIGRAARLEPDEIVTAWALDCLLYDKKDGKDRGGKDQDAETPRRVSLSAIGAALTSKKQTDEDKDAGWKKAQRDVSHLFVHAYPRVGLAMQTRTKGVRRGDYHMYASRWMLVAQIAVEEFEREQAAILCSKEIKREDMGPAIEAARERIAVASLCLFDPVDTLIIGPDQKPFAVVTQAQAKELCRVRPDLFEGPRPKFKAAPYTYTPAPEPPKPEEKVFSESAFDQAQARLRMVFEKEFWSALEREDFDLARLHVRRTKEGIAELYDRAKQDFEAMCDRWVEIAGSNEGRHTQNQTYNRDKENYYLVSENGYDGPVDGDQESGQDKGVSYPKKGYEDTSNPNKASDLKNQVLHNCEIWASADAIRGPRTGAEVGYFGPGAYLVDQGADSLPCELLEKLEVDNSTGPDHGDLGTGAILQNGVDQEAGTVETIPDAELLDQVVTNPPVELEGSINFDSALDAALWYAGGGLGAKFPVLPVCQWVKDAARCSWDKHGPDCKGRKPLVKGPEGQGNYAGATLDLEKIEKWFTGQFKGQGVAIRTDGHLLADFDAKDGGIQSCREFCDTWALPETLTQITQGAGLHLLFELPEGLPVGYLKSWVRIGDKVGLPGFDIKVHTGGLMFVEPTMGPKGAYRWVNIDAEIIVLPREVCDFLREAKYKETPEQKSKAARASARVYSSSSPDSKQFDSDQSKYFVDVPEGDRHARLLTVGNAIRRQTGASAAQIEEAMRYHAARFSSPLDDEKWIRRTSESLERGF